MVINKYTSKYICVFMYLTYTLKTWKNTNEYYSTLERNEILTHAIIWMKLERYYAK